MGIENMKHSGDAEYIIIKTSAALILLALIVSHLFAV